jgi:uncharacterized repeat protein (TIGR01451 family)
MVAPKSKLFFSFVFSVGLVLLLLGALQAARPQVRAAETLDIRLDARNGPCVAGPHSGAIASDESWCLADSPHLVDGEVTVNPGVTLTVEPGVVVQGNTGGQLKVQGRLVSLGTPAQPITFTSQSDTGRYQWEGLVFDEGTGHMDHTTVRYAGRNNQVPDVQYANIVVTGVLDGQVRIENSHVLSEGITATDYGLYIEDSHVVVSGTRFSGNSDGSGISTDYALYATGANTVITLTSNIFGDNEGYAARVEAGHLSPVWMTGHTFFNNGENRVLVEGGPLVRAATLAAQTGLDGYELRTDLSVLPGMTLTVEPGVTALARANVELLVQGHLAAPGTASQPIMFTAIDSGYGWDGLVFDGGTGELDDVTVSYGGSYGSGVGSTGTRGNVSVVGGQLNIQGGQVSHERGGSGADYGLYVENSQVVVSGTTFSANGSGGDSDYALYFTGGSTDITITGNAFESNDAFAIGAPAANWHQAQLTDNAFSGSGDQARRIHLAGGTLGTNTTLVWQTGLDGYEPDSLVVLGGTTLNVGPGVTVLTRNASDLRVQGNLVAQGTASRPIVFTADNADPGWDGLFFEGGAGDLRHVTIGQGSGSVNSNITVQGGQLRLEDSQVQGKIGVPGGNDYGLYVDNSLVVISGTEFSNIGSTVDDYALYATGGSAVVTATKSMWQDNNKGVGVNGGRVFLSCVDVVNSDRDGIQISGGSFSVVGSGIQDNAGVGLNNGSGAAVSALYNWWGDASGPSGVGPGTGDDVSSNVDYTPWLSAPTCVLDLGVQKSAWPDPVYVEDPLVYTITVVNRSPAPAANVVVTDWLPANLSLGAVTPSQGHCSGTDALVTCTLGTLAGRAHADYADATVRLVVTPSVEAAGVITNLAAVSGQDLDPWTDNNTLPLTTVVKPQVDLVLVKFDAPDPAGTGILLIYTLVVTNHGPSTATGVVLSDVLPITNTLPVSLTFVQATASQGTGCGEAGGVVTCDLGDILRDDTVTATIWVTVTGAGILTNVASVGSAEFDYDTTNNAVSERTSVATADLALAKSGAPGQLRVGETLTYTLVVTNAEGPLPATGVTLVDTLPPSVSLPLTVTFGSAMLGPCEDNAVDHSVTCALGTLDVGATAVVTLVVQATAGGTLTNTASVASNEYDPQLEDNTAWSTSVVPVADLAVAKRAAPGPLAVGDVLTCTIVVTNGGPWPDAGVVLTDELPLNVSDVGAVSSQGNCAVGSGLVVCDLGVLGAGASAGVTVTVRPTSAGLMRNGARVAGAEFDPDPANDTAEIYTPVGIAQLEVRKRATPQPAEAGQLLTYTLTITNHGPDAATGVIFTDTLPPSVSLAWVTSEQGDCGAMGTFNAPFFVCHLGALPAGTATAATLVVTPTAGGTLVNTVEVRADEADTDLDDNLDQVSVVVQSGSRLYLPLLLKLTATGTSRLNP